MDPLSLIKQYGYAALFVGLLVFIAWVDYHGHQAEKDHEAAVQAVADKKEADHVQQVESNAATTISSLQSRLSAALIEPIKPSVSVRMCPRPAAYPTDSPQVPLATSDAVGGSSGGVGSSDPRASEGIDTAPATESILKRDKAIIDYLQGYVRECQVAGVCAKE